MMTAKTPEGRVKDRIKSVLKKYETSTYYHMPVQNGMGSPTLDFVGCSLGRYFAIEAKAPGERPTPRQNLTIRDMQRASAIVFVIDGTTDEGVHSLEVLELWLSP